MFEITLRTCALEHKIVGISIVQGGGKHKAKHEEIDEKTGETKDKRGDI